MSFVSCTLFFCATRTIRISLRLNTVKYPLLDILSKIQSFFFFQWAVDPFFQILLNSSVSFNGRRAALKSPFSFCFSVYQFHYYCLLLRSAVVGGTTFPESILCQQVGAMRAPAHTHTQEAATQQWRLRRVQAWSSNKSLLGSTVEGVQGPKRGPWVGGSKGGSRV